MCISANFGWTGAYDIYRFWYSIFILETPILGAKLPMRRETLKAIEVARDQLINNLHQERKGSKMQTLGASNPHNNSPFSAYPKSISTSCEFFHKDFLYQHSEPNNFCSIYFNTISAPKIPLGCWQNQMGAVFCCHYHHHQNSKR